VITHLAEQLRIQTEASIATVTQGAEDRLMIASPSKTNGLRIEVWERQPADIEVALFVPDKRGSPFEVLLIGSQAEELDVAADALELVCDLIAERKVLGMHSGFWHGGGKVIEVGELSAETRRGLSWIVSWRGTYDWSAPHG